MESHGDYPKYKVLDDPEIRVSGAKDEGMNYAWEYYVNQIHQVDDFIGQLIDMLKKINQLRINKRFQQNTNNVRILSVRYSLFFWNLTHCL